MGAASGALALGFGRARVVSVLGQPLEATVPIRLEPGEDLSGDCLSAEVFYGESRQPNSAVSVALRTLANGERAVAVRSSTMIDEPVVSIYVTAGCQARMTRKWVAFADPPTATLADAPQVVGDDRSAQAAGTGPGPGATGAQAQPSLARLPADLGPEDTPRRRASAPARSTATARASAAPRPKVAREDSVVRRPQASPGPRSVVPQPPADSPALRLELVEAESLMTPSLKFSNLTSAPPEDGGPQRAAAAALWRALNATPEELLRDKQTLQQFEDDLKRLRGDMTQARGTVSGLEARVREAEASRYNNPLVWALGALAALLAGSAFWLWRSRREAIQSRDAWWQASRQLDQAKASGAVPLAESASAASLPGQLDDSEPGVLVSRPAALPGAATAAPGPDTLAARAAAGTASQWAPSEPFAPPAVALTQADAAPRQVSVEELIDLEQQAEFFVVLGQDDAAIDLLLGHLRSPAGGTSPMPYLKLMEIYQRRGERAEYERIREQFNRQFNGYAPAWEEDLTHGRTIEDYPGVLGRLQRLWATPRMAMEVLQTSLLRQDERFGTFDLPAYRDLLMLYAVARDLAERDEGGVDLLLPIGAETRPSEFDTGKSVMMRPLVAEAAPGGAESKPPPIARVIDTGPAPLEFQHDDLDLTQPGPKRSDKAGDA